MLAELRLAFSVVPSPERLHAPCVVRDRALPCWLERGQVEQAVVELETHLDDSLAELPAARQGVTSTGSPQPR